MLANQFMEPIDILLVEDSPGDIRLIIEALKEAKVYNKLNVVHDGEEALAYLFRQGKYARAKRPDLVLLDLNLPRKEGREVLAEIKANENLKSIPVIILTTSKADEDIFQAYNLHANCYITKPVDIEEFLAVVRSIEIFWLTIIQLPKGEQIERF